MANYVFLGPPGAGKGTMAEMCHTRFHFVHISTGDILREEMKKGSELGRQAKEYVDSGKLVPDEVVAAIVSRRLSDFKVAENGCILDGYPRTVKQAGLLEDALRENQLSLTAAVLFEVDDDLLIRRLTARRVCRNCGAVYNVIYNPPRQENVCDKCGGELYQRSDDSRETALQRLTVYEQQTAPLIEYYDERNSLIRVTGAQQKEENFAVLCEALGL
jgi:adenylate kinase